MKNIKTVILLLVLTTISFAQTAGEAVNLLEDEQGFGIRAAALGNAYTGVADDYSAIYWNPAGLAQIKHREFSGALYHLTYSSDVSYLNESTSDKRAFTKLHNMGLVFPFPVSRGSLVMAFGYQKIKGLDSYLNFSGYLPGTSSNYLGFDINNDLGEYGILDFDRDVQQNLSNTFEGSLSEWSFGMAIDVSARFSAGFTLNLVSGGSDFVSKYQQDDINNMNGYDIYDEADQKIEEFQYKYYDVQYNINSDYTALQAKLGGLFHAGDYLRLGGTLTLPMTLRVDELWNVSDELAYDIHVLDEGLIYQFAEEADLNEGEFDYDISVPFRFSGGLSFQNNFLLLAASADYTDWSQLRYEMPDDRNSDDYSTLLDQNELFANDYQAVLSWGLGAEVNLFQNALSLRGGYRYVPTPLKDVSSDYDKKYYTAGIGMRLDESSILEASYMYGSHKQDANYYYDWDDFGDIEPMKTSEDYTTQKVLVGIKLLF